MAAALLGDGHAAWHLATCVEAVDRGLVMHSSDEIYSPTSLFSLSHSLSHLETRRCGIQAIADEGGHRARRGRALDVEATVIINKNLDLPKSARNNPDGGLEAS